MSRVIRRPMMCGLFVCLLCSSGLLQADEAPSLVVVRKIWDQAPHNAFSDLVRYQEQWFCTFREADAHGGIGGTLRVITSGDGDQWQSASHIRLSQNDLAALKLAVPPSSARMDLRDPKLCVAPDGQLTLLAGVYYNDGHDLQSLVWFSRNGVDWSKPFPVGEHQYWLWRTTWHNGKAYGVGRVPTKRVPRLYVSQDGRDFDVLARDDDFFPYNPGPSEATIRFTEDDTALCLIRLSRVPGGTTHFAHLGTARPPYSAWSWRSLDMEIGGPNLIQIPDKRWVAAFRIYGKQTRKENVRTALCWLDPSNGTAREFLTLPSGGDSSYPGLVWHDNLLWVSYYSSHEGKAAIYLAKVKFGD